MASKAENNLRSLLSKTELLAPPQHFAEEVMREIEAIAEDNVYADAKLMTMLREQGLRAPAKDFTYKVLKQLRQQPSHRIDQPIISKAAWAIIALFVVIYLIIALVTGVDSGTTTKQHDFISIGKYLSDVFSRFRETFLFLVVIACSTIVLLSADYFFKRKIDAGL